MNKNLQQVLLKGILDVFRPLADLATDEEGAKLFFNDLGWDIAELMDGDVTSLLSIFGIVSQSISQVETVTKIGTAGSISSFAKIRSSLEATGSLVDSVQLLTTLPLGGNTAEKFCADVLQKLITIYLLNNAQTFYSLCTVAGVIEPESLSIAKNGKLIKYISRVPTFSLAKLITFLKAPKQQFAAEYWPNGDAEFATIQSTNEIAQKLLPRMVSLFNTLGIPASPSGSSSPTPFSTADTVVLEGSINIAKSIRVPGIGELELGCGAGLLPTTYGGPGIYLAPYGAANLQAYVNNWLVQLKLSTEIDGLVFKKDSVQILSTSITSQGNIILKASTLTNDNQVVGNQTGTSLQLGSIEVGVDLGFTAASRTVDAYVNLANSIFAIHPDEGDSFLRKIVPVGGIDVKLSALLGWSNTKGLYFGGRAGLKNTIQVNGRGANKFLKITSIDTALLLTDKLVVSIAISGNVTLGPVKVTVGETGLQMSLASVPAGGNAGPFDVSLGFVTPTSFGIEVNSDTLTGGGYLLLDPGHHRYAGAAQLLLKTGTREINLTALGLLQTELPGNPGAYSLVLLLTATFAPVQLGLGFTLSGLGGLLGVNRAANTDVLRGLVRGGGLGQLLFPPDVLDHPAAALALVDAAFPAAEGRYVIGLLARIGWGVPRTLITLDVALLVELPAPVRLAMVGVLQASLPDKDHELLKLRADFLGSVDFGAKQAAFDAALSDSKLWKFALTGDMAFRLYQGQHPLFVITAGGFHPAFQPPAGAALAGLRRLTLSLNNDNDLRLTLASYFAVTANTVQFGSQLDLYVRIARGLHVEGHFGFDVLFQFNPFHVLAHVEAGVAVKYGSRELLSLHLALDVTGPGPWHLWGEASFKAWFVRVRVHVNATIGTGAPEPALPATDVHALLVSALDAAASWEVEAPQTVLPGGVVLRPAAGATAQLFLDPRGALVLRQRVAPLGLQLEKYGSGAAAPVNGQRFDLTELVVGPDRYAAADHAVEVVRDFFAPDQFRRLTDAQKLSAPSFQRLPCGLRLKRLAGLVADPRATRRVVEYERKLVDGTSGGVTTAAPLKMSGEVFQQLARGGALGQAVQAAQPSARAPRPVGWAEDTYAVVHAATLAVYDAPDHARFGSQAEAEQYRQGLVARQPALADEVLVVPSYELALA